jgi:hypothetical protein
MTPTVGTSDCMYLAVVVTSRTKGTTTKTWPCLCISDSIPNNNSNNYTNNNNSNNNYYLNTNNSNKNNSNNDIE